MDNDTKEPQVRVVDRRWWARNEAVEATDEATLRKPTYVEELERQLENKATELQTIVAEHRRSQDEFEQARLRIRRDVAREVERGKRAILSELLDVVDNLDRAVAAARQRNVLPADQMIEQLTRGVELVRDQFLAKLGAFGIARIDALGRKFDAAWHDAVTTAPVEDSTGEGVVVAVVREGYAIGDEVLRPASVVVGRSS